MIWRDREGQTVPGDAGQDRLLEWMYGTAVGRCFVRLMIVPRVSQPAAWLTRGTIISRPKQRPTAVPYIPSRSRSCPASPGTVWPSRYRQIMPGPRR